MSGGGRTVRAAVARDGVVVADSLDARCRVRGGDGRHGRQALAGVTASVRRCLAHRSPAGWRMSSARPAGEELGQAGGGGLGRPGGGDIACRMMARRTSITPRPRRCVPRPLAAMLPYLTEHFGNPSGTHAVARRRPVGHRRRPRRGGRGASAASPARSSSPSGGTEADNLAVLGAPPAAAEPGPCCARPSSTTPCATPARAVGGTTVAVDGAGRHRPRRPGRARSAPGSALVSVMLVNNEVGTIAAPGRGG